MKETIRRIVPEAEEALRYQMPTFQSRGKNLVHFAAFKKHIGFYPTPVVVTAFRKDLTQYKTSKGAVQFPLSGTLPLGLVERMVKYRIKEMMRE